MLVTRFKFQGREIEVVRSVRTTASFLSTVAESYNMYLNGNSAFGWESPENVIRHLSLLVRDDNTEIESDVK